ncbi:MAG: dTDP-glucose 4,6-dehydratase [Bacteroidetes bacterium]|nr:MAG: dTDP-glucose 4,6-dehydratase [Bacteroidota bacterium]PIE87697.1 MAG: dTDP-glucose 4,6-dehydratase [Bacteroidota bacterium]
MKKTLLITGGAGFIGSHLVRHFVQKYPEYRIVNVDKLTYAGNLENLKAIEEQPNYHFEKADIIDNERMIALFEKYRFDSVIHLAAESHVDRSISNPMAFIHTNIVGTVTLLNVARSFWGADYRGKRFYHVSTDEVYGSLGEVGFFTEKTAYDPHSPYSASKASSDHLVRAYFHTYGLPVVISNCSNNYGPFQFPEKLLPLFIHRIRDGKSLPVYGKGENVRDWLYVGDHCDAIDMLFHEGKSGETYNIGGNNEWKNIDLIRLLCRVMDKRLQRAEGESEKLITFVKDRAGHDLRYAIDASKIKNEFNWEPKISFPEGLAMTVDWYLNHEAWLNNVTSGNYLSYYEEQYGRR